MAETKFQLGRLGGSAAHAGIDEGLRAYMLKVYNYMGLGLGLSGAVALLVASSPALLQSIFGGPQAYLVMLAPFAFLSLIHI